MDLGFRGEDRVVDAEQGQVRADMVHHHRHRRLAERRQPFALGGMDEPVAMFGGELLADRLQIVAGIIAFGDLADILAERLAVAQVRRAGEHVDLAAGIVDIIFAGDAVPRIFEQAGQRVADHGAAAMAHMHRAGRVGRDIFDVDPLAAAHVGAAIFLALGEDGTKLLLPDRAAEPDVDEAGSGDVGRFDLADLAQLRHDHLGERARRHAGALGQHHRRIGREVAMAGVARRLDRHGAAGQAGQQPALGLEGVERGGDMRGKAGVKGQDEGPPEGKARL